LSGRSYLKFALGVSPLRKKGLPMTDLTNWMNRFAILLFCAVAAIASSAQTFNTLARFNGANGSYPAGALVQGTDGKLYGTTVLGGISDNPCGSLYHTECGTVFNITRGGELTRLFSFGPSEGGHPNDGLMLANDGYFYGAAFGVNEICSNSPECGTVFKVTPAGNLTVIYSHFCINADCLNGDYPYAGLIQASDGNLYGTTSTGGYQCSRISLTGGTVFKITPAGILTTLHDFCAYSTDGAVPLAGLIQGTDGEFYGTTSQGGAHGGGTVFRIASTGELTTVYSFCSQANCTDGHFPDAGLVQGADGNFYGTTVMGGVFNNSCSTYPGCGTIFKITPAGKLTTLYDFCTQSGCTDGNTPYAGLIQGTDGELYGTTSQGGFYSPSCSLYNLGCGTVFKITPAGALTTVYTFCSQTNCTDGADPIAGLVQATDGNFYGTTTIGGGATGYYCVGLDTAIGCGTVFRLSTGLGPFVSLPQDSGKVGQTGAVLGQGLTGTTGVFVNGTSASFTVVSDTFIRATVPSGATTGFVTVNTPSGTLTSNVPFHVIQ
jgi:uncharacterized repeat protein (TIGR03803 family)